MFICSCELIAPGRRHTCFGVGGRLVGVKEHSSSFCVLTHQGVGGKFSFTLQFQCDGDASFSRTGWVS